MGQMYCLGCFYNLRGLRGRRCPECGREFSPDNPASYSPTATPERLYKLVKQASAMLTDALSVLETTDPATAALAPVRRQMARLSAENAALRGQVAGLTQLLLDRGLIDPAELAEAIDAAEIEADVPVVDDTPAAAEAAEATPELLDLERVVASTRRNG